MYNKKYYDKHKTKILQQNHQYYLNNKQKILIRNRKWLEKNKEKYREQRHQHYLKIRKLHPLSVYGRKEVCRRYYLKNKQKIREKQKIYERLNPRSRGNNYSIELQDAMANIRKRDNNTCQWQNCGLTQRQAPIHVHHIFPRSEYPELQLIEKYMICYCANHHGMWHRYRGDQNAINFLQRFDSVVAVMK